VALLRCVTLGIWRARPFALHSGIDL